MDDEPLSATNYDEGIINTMEQIAIKSSFKSLTAKYAKTIANKVLESYRGIKKLKIDRYIRYNSRSSDPLNKIEVRSTKPNNAFEENWTPLIPGDIIYYPCAFGIQIAEHFGVYIGMGYVIQVWCQKDCVTPSFLKVVTKMFDDEAEEQPNGYVLMTKLKHFTPGEKHICGDKNIYVYDPSTYRFTRQKIIENAIEKIGDFEYDILERDCQTFALQCATGDSCHVYRNKNGKSKELQKQRIEDTRLHLKSDQTQGLTKDHQRELDKQILISLQTELTNPEDIAEAEELFIKFNK
jgi:hypothetical protein